MEPSLKIGDQTPWGPATEVRPLADGICVFETHSHGGMYVEPRVLNATMPMFMIDATHAKLGRQGWFEEDRDIQLPLLLYSDKLKHANLGTAEEALNLIQKSLPDVYTRWIRWRTPNTPQNRIVIEDHNSKTYVSLRVVIGDKEFELRIDVDEDDDSPHELRLYSVPDGDMMLRYAFPTN